jgi:tight adherence protein B
MAIEPTTTTLPPFVYGIIFLLCGVLALATGAALFFFQRFYAPEPSAIRQRLQRFKHIEEESQKELLTDRGLARLLKDPEFANAALGKILAQYSFAQHLRRLLRQAGVKVPLDRYFMLFFVLPWVLGLIISPQLGLLSAFGGVALLNTLVYFNLVRLKRQRLGQLTLQLPDALSLVTSSLRAGHSFQTALSICVSELAEPISSEFGQVVNDINLGLPLKDSLHKLVYNVDSLPDIQMFTTAVLIQKESGGNLAEVLDKLSFTIRERFKLKRQISALTGQSRMTGYVLGLAPLFLIIFLSIFMYSYIRPLWETGTGHMLLMIAMMLQIAGFFVMRRIVDIRI